MDTFADIIRFAAVGFGVVTGGVVTLMAIIMPFAYSDMKKATEQRDLLRKQVETKSKKKK